MKRFLSMILCILLVIGLLPTQAFATETTEETTVIVTEEPLMEAALSEELIPVTNAEAFDNEELFSGYVQRLFYGNPNINTRSVGAQSAGAKLTGDEARVYNALVPVVKQIAEGKRSSTEITMSSSSDVKVTFTETFDTFDYTRVVDSLCADYPYEMYWFNYAIGFAVSGSYYGDTGTIAEFTICFTVDVPFRSGGAQFKTNTSKTAAASAAAKNAQAIAQKYSTLSDYEKLCAFRDEICSLVEYDYDAADNDTYDENLGPWQLIYVFDKNSSTNVVCEGYAEAFQYLCDMSGLTCYSISGYTGGGHKWNIVTLEGKNYLVDVTNVDDGGFGSDGSLFLAGGKGSVSSGYTFTNSYGNKLTYTYKEKTIDMWGTKVLTLASSNYKPTAHTHNYSSKVTPPTCTEEGYTTYTCGCGDSYKGNYKDPTGHSYGAWKVTTAATCTAKGEERRDCVNCDQYETRATNAKEHDYTEIGRAHV